MKILFLCVILANIFVTLWEYRYGQAFAPETTAIHLPETDEGLEPIRLVSELSMPSSDKAAQSRHPQ